MPVGAAFVPLKRFAPAPKSSTLLRKKTRRCRAQPRMLGMKAGFAPEYCLVGMRHWA